MLRLEVETIDIATRQEYLIKTDEVKKSTLNKLLRASLDTTIRCYRNIYRIALWSAYRAYLRENIKTRRF